LAGVDSLVAVRAHHGVLSGIKHGAVLHDAPRVAASGTDGICHTESVSAFLIASIPALYKLGQRLFTTQAGEGLHWDTVRVIRYRQHHRNGDVVEAYWLTNFPSCQITHRITPIERCCPKPATTKRPKLLPSP
jgi:hypothetical protein